MGQFCQIYKPWKRIMRDMVKEKQAKMIKLSVYDHNGHSGVWSTPDNLLDGKKDTYYASKSGTTANDWITFQMHSAALITKIKIRNNWASSAIHSIALFFGSDKEMFKLCEDIQNIQMGDDVMQEFDIFDSLLLSEHYLWQNKHKFNLIKVKILKNHVHD